MAYEDIVRSHVRQLLRDGMELDEVVMDGDGDFPFRHGTAMYYVSTVFGGHMTRIWSNAVYGVKTKGSVLREVNSANESLLHGRVFIQGSTLVVEAYLPIESLEPGTWPASASRSVAPPTRSVNWSRRCTVAASRSTKPTSRLPADGVSRCPRPPWAATRHRCRACSCAAYGARASMGSGIRRRPDGAGGRRQLIRVPPMADLAALDHASGLLILSSRSTRRLGVSKTRRRRPTATMGISGAVLTYVALREGPPLPTR